MTFKTVPVFEFDKDKVTLEADLERRRVVRHYFYPRIFYDQRLTEGKDYLLALGEACISGSRALDRLRLSCEALEWPADLTRAVK